MSSHHFVKEGQEPALFIVEPTSLNILGPLLEWAPMVLVADTALEEVLKWKIKIDVLLINKGNVVFEEMLWNQGPVELIYYSSFENMLEVAIDFLATRKNSGINFVMNASDQVFDKLLAKVEMFDVVILTTEMKWSAVAGSFKKWLPQGTVLSTKRVNEFILSGLKNHAHGSFETEKDGAIEIKSKKPFWIGEMLN